MYKPSVICVLIAVLILSACVRPFSPTPNEMVLPDQSEIHPALENIPVFPGSTAWTEGIPGMDGSPKSLKTYSYVVNVFKHKTLMKFYEEEMTDDGWETLGKREDSKTKSADVMFSKDKTVAHFQMIPWTANSYLVGVVFYDEPATE